MNEITISPAVPSSAVSTPESPPGAADLLLTLMARAVQDPTIDVAKLESLLRMHARMAFIQAMALAQAEMQPVLRNARNDVTNSRYADLEAVDAAIRPVYTRHGFNLTFNSEPIDGAAVRIVCETSHLAGHTKEYRLDAALDTVGPKGTGNKTPLHGLGSSISYLRRYLTCMVFNVILTNEDNDGNRVRGPTGLLTPAQVAELNALMVQTRTLERKFLDVMAPDLVSIEQARAADFPRLKNALLTKMSVLRQRGALAPPQGTQPAGTAPPDRWNNWRQEVRQEDARRKGTSQ